MTTRWWMGEGNGTLRHFQLEPWSLLQVTTITTARSLDTGGMGSNGVTSQIGWGSVKCKLKKKLLPSFCFLMGKFWRLFKLPQQEGEKSPPSRPLRPESIRSPLWLHYQNSWTPDAQLIPPGWSMRSDKRPYLGTNVDRELFRAEGKLLRLTEPCRAVPSRAELSWGRPWVRCFRARRTLSARCVGRRLDPGSKTHNSR